MKAEGTGRVFGQTTIISAGSSKPGISLGSYAQWGIRHPAWGRDYDRDIHFQADREGRFSIDGVPAGLVTVYLNTRGLHADIVRTRTRAAQVVEGQATEVRFFDSSGEWDLPLEFVVDGSEKQFQSGTGRGPSPSSKSHPQDKPEPLRFTVRLEAKPGQRLSYPPEEEVSIPGFNNRRTVVHDVSPGKYRLVVFHRDDAIRYRASGVPAFEADIDFKSQGPPIRVNLVGK
jgi:hypothetical protein